MVLTPSSVSSGLSGMGFWALVWATVCKIDTLPLINKILSKEKVFRWVNKNRGTTLLMTELTNFAIHGVENPNAVTMAVGGSVMNAIWVFLLIPFQQRKLNKATQIPVLGKVKHA